jgi:predicted N-formylglutamate amidohydrolase
VSVADDSQGQEPDAGAAARRSLVLTCEHGGNLIPEEYARAFGSQAARDALSSHRGLDIGALAMARALARRFDAPLIASEVSRLLCDLNRSLNNSALFSEFALGLTPAERERVLTRHYHPHRQRVEQELSPRLAHGVLHVAVHSFTPELRGEVRRADIGLLYDPARPGETAWCERYKRALGRLAPELRVRRNYPYLGKTDGLATFLRRKYPATSYVGVELEVNQALLTGAEAQRKQVLAAISDALLELLEQSGYTSDRFVPRRTSTGGSPRQR